MRVADLAIIGAGPTGLEAAAGAARAGLSAVVLEAGAVAQHVHTWRWVRLFSPFELNAGPAGLGLLRGRGVRLPAPEAILTGEELRTRYLLPLAAAVRSSIEIREGARVRDVARADRLKGEALGSVARADRPFRLLVEENGAETEVFARAVFDCSGTWGQPGWAGPGGAPARGERAARRAIEYHLPDPLGAQRDRYAGRRTLLLGAGHSAATTAVALAALARVIPGTRFTWASRRVSDVPLRPIDEDPLPERAELTRRANAVAVGAAPRLRVAPRGQAPRRQANLRAGSSTSNWRSPGPCGTTTSTASWPASAMSPTTGCTGNSRSTPATPPSVRWASRRPSVRRGATGRPTA
ncbi:hypothetical protein [Candidatus Palauibacter sp.]|uniref:hypothetical protein n=1 Tax=Candidatus Palauibacter sp. TaxID=3101350 RepID=UPI003B594A28